MSWRPNLRPVGPKLNVTKRSACRCPNSFDSKRSLWARQPSESKDWKKKSRPCKASWQPNGSCLTLL
eukprot:12530318-Prorocentrum_lima.AAC.1